jgi:uncharacterized protein HemX
MRATLSFKLPEESEEHQTCLNGGVYKSALQELDNWLRAKLKYENLTDETSKAFQDTRDQLHELLKEEDISLF